MTRRPQQNAVSFATTAGGQSSGRRLTTSPRYALVTRSISSKTPTILAAARCRAASFFPIAGSGCCGDCGRVYRRLRLTCRQSLSCTVLITAVGADGAAAAANRVTAAHRGLCDPRLAASGAFPAKGSGGLTANIVVSLADDSADQRFRALYARHGLDDLGKETFKLSGVAQPDLDQVIPRAR